MFCLTCAVSYGTLETEDEDKVTTYNIDGVAINDMQDGKPSISGVEVNVQVACNDVGSFGTSVYPTEISQD